MSQFAFGDSVAKIMTERSLVFENDLLSGRKIHF